MPRIEIDSPAIGKYCEETGNGSSTWDVCRDCADDVIGSDLSDVPKLGEPYNGEPSEGAVIIESDGGPPIEDMEDNGDKCAICNCKLKENNY